MSLPKKILLLLLLLITFIAACVYTKVEQIANELTPPTQEALSESTQTTEQSMQVQEEQTNEQAPQESLTPEEAFKKVDENADLKEAATTPVQEMQETQETQANMEKLVEQNFEEEKKTVVDVTADESVQTRINKILENNGILFQRMSAYIAEDSRTTLEKIAKIIIDNPKLKIEIAGHTDAKGDDSYNQTVSEQRAESVKNRLVELGVDSKRLIAKGYGETKPLVPNDQDGYSLINRRVEINIIEE